MSKFGVAHVVLAVLGVERRGVAATTDYEVCVLSLMSAETIASENVGILTCGDQFRSRLCER